MGGFASRAALPLYKGLQKRGIKWVALIGVGMEATNPTERVRWLTQQYDLSTKNAKALILTELGFSSSGIASRLDVTESTARKYLANLEDEIGEYVTQSLPKPVRYPTYPGDTPKSEVEHTTDHIDLSPEFSERQRPLAGPSIDEIPKELITLNHNVEVEQ